VIPAYNSAWCIERCLNALLVELKEFPLQVIVVDDGSTDATAALMTRYADRVTFVSQSNQGPGAARNAGVAKALADYVAFVDSDDVILPGRLRMQYDFMKQCPEVVLTFGAIAFMSAPKIPYLSTLEVTEEWRRLEDPYRHLLTCGGECVNTMTVMVPKTVLVAAGGFNTRFRCGEDTDLWVRLAELGTFAYHGRPMALVNDVKAGGKLTRSPYVYTHGPKVLLEILMRDTRLTPEDRKIACKLVKKSVEMMLRYDWTHLGRRQMLADIAFCGPVFGQGFERKWKLISCLPAGIGRAGRWGRTLLRRLTG